MENQRKVSIMIYINENIKDLRKIEEVTYGIEEEGIPYTIVRSKEKLLVDLATLASMESKLDVGIGIDENFNAALYYAKLPEDYLLFKRELTYRLEDAKTLGANAACMVKGVPFKMEGGSQ